MFICLLCLPESRFLVEEKIRGFRQQLAVSHKSVDRKLSLVSMVGMLDALLVLVVQQIRFG